jgi:signal transduction histidine kinase
MVLETPGSRLLRERGMTFFGTITASLSHEINNVLAIVGELSGLLGDLIHGAASGRPLDAGRLAGISSRINDQVERGKQLVKRLNRFAHTVDQPVTAVSVNETMELITTLCQRFARLKKVSLETAFPEQDLVIESSSFGLMQAVQLCIDLALSACLEGTGTVIAGFDPTADGCVIFITCTEPIPLDQGTTDRLSYLSLLMTELGGRLICSLETVPCRFMLHAPRKHGSGQQLTEELGGV